MSTQEESHRHLGTTRIRRRALFNAALAAPFVVTARRTEAQVTLPPPSPPTTPWVEELPLQDTPLLATTFASAPTLLANIAGGECGRAEHQRYFDMCGLASRTTYDALQYEMTAKENPGWKFNADNAYYPAQPIWGFAAGGPGAMVASTTPGPTIHARYGHPILCRIHNALPAFHTGFGSPEISTHLHNMHTPSESDGFAGDFYSATRRGPTMTSSGSYMDHFYPNCYAGIDEYDGVAGYGRIGDPREALGSLFYHDHNEGFTAPNVLKGLAGRYNIFDDLDSGSEESGLRLPSGAYDYPLTFSDRRFDVNGRLAFNQLDSEGVVGDKISVNGKLEPVLRVARRKYRFRLLNAGPSRFYQLYLQNKTANGIFPFTVISSDGNLLPNPLLNQTSVRMAPAERFDIVIDFARFPLGTELFLVNQLLQVSTRRPDRLQAPGTRLLKLVVDRAAPQADTSVVPSVLRPLRPLPTEAQLAALPVRRFNFERSGGMWSINGRFFNVFQPAFTVPKGSTEIWELFNANDGWQHPVHIHFEEGRILSKSVNGIPVPIPVHERGRKDVFNVGENMTIRVLMRFRDFTGKYMMHCHNLVHEDHSMMLRFDIV